MKKIGHMITYMCGQPGQAHIAGRAAANFRPGPEFATLPPHMDLDSEEAFLAKVGGYGAIVSGYDAFPDSFRPMVPMMLASIQYHAVWICEHVHR